MLQIYCDFVIFKMAAAAIFDFQKFKNSVGPL